MSDKSIQKWPIKDPGANTTLLSTIFAHYIHQNTLMYGRSNIIFALQAAGFTAGFAGGNIWGGIALIVTGIITICLKQMINRDRQCRDANLKLMQKIEEELLPGDEWIADKGATKGIFPFKIRVGSRPEKEWAAAGFLYNNIITILIVADFVLAIIAFAGHYHR